ncbi:Kinesin-related protein 4 [Choanephora cucurbitarum]|uniref:Kinesin-like protein n=1 Tax=Choanephora cucurbitarum TaxID=101091 RepID=A0A1C7NJ98_9FUNG|nr:Kinesin-related protein 4 [Choanephora cucurbitarum]
MSYSSLNDRPITPPTTPICYPSKSYQSFTSIYPSPTSSSSPSISSSTSKPSYSTKSTSIRENVQVMVRCRPRSQREIAVEEEPCWVIRPEDGTIELAQLKSSTFVQAFQFDNVLMGVDNSKVYQAGISDLVRSTMMGYNGTVFAYGQTASGTEKEPGVIPRAVQDVFSFIEEETSGREYLLRVSYMEIYNERIKDLLNTENNQLEIVEDKKGVRVRNLREKIVKTPQEVLNCIKEGESNRHISATDYNQHSSRSHTVFQLVIESKSKRGASLDNNRGVLVSQLNLIDLAGSEKVATDIQRRKEGAYINKSLLTLGNVISKLTSDVPATHIPFRNSKLTRILQAALSGNARIAVICTINPTLASKHESLSTLRFAQRAKLIKTAAKMTRIGDNSELQNCLIKIAELQTKMQEKTDLEAETRERLKSLLSLILTSSKTNEDASAKDDEMVACLSDVTDDLIVKETTMQDVVARCEEVFAAQVARHQRQMDRMTTTIESLQSALRVRESVNTKQNETLTKRDAYIEKLKRELNTYQAQQTTSLAQSTSSPKNLKAPSTHSFKTVKSMEELNSKKSESFKNESSEHEQQLTSIVKEQEKTIQDLLKKQNEMEDHLKALELTEQSAVVDFETLIPIVAEKITIAISDAVQGMMSDFATSENPDLIQTTHHAIFAAVKGSMASVFTHVPTTENEVDTTAITLAIQDAIQSLLVCSMADSCSTSSTTGSKFISVQEAASLIQSEMPSYIYESFCLVDEPDTFLPELMEQSDQPLLKDSLIVETRHCYDIASSDSTAVVDDRLYSVPIHQMSSWISFFSRCVIFVFIMYFLLSYD